ncbi:aldehyde dehydrogenase family protein, partial [Vreelandella neptunia]|uniref:aldehyde dehydrogenase family protein n=1 Tax=Vreelandella neptunia TaxID=115551 RepID=UPI0030EDCDC3
MVAAITPWNSPIASEAQKVAPALAAGNAAEHRMVFGYRQRVGQHRRVAEQARSGIGGAAGR